MSGAMIAWMTKEPKVGDVVWYAVGADTARQQAEIVTINGSTRARIRILTGPQTRVVLDAPWGVIEPLEK